MHAGFMYRVVINKVMALGRKISYLLSEGSAIFTELSLRSSTMSRVMALRLRGHFLSKHDAMRRYFARSHRLQ